MKNKIITSEGNVQFQTADGSIINVHPFHIYTVFNEDTVSFLLIAMPKSSGLAIFTSKAEDLEVDGTVYTIDELPNALSEAFAKAGAVARYEIVDELPTSGQSNTIYLVPKSEGIGYDEYIYVNGEWELIGDTDIELDRYVDKETFSGYTADTLVLINTVSGSVITESERAISAETALQTAIDNEASARTDADEALEDYIDAVSGAVDNVQDEVDILSAALEDEVSARTQADEALSGAVDSVISDLASEVSRATAKENEIDTKVDGEISNREAADTVISGAVDTLSTSLSNEVQRAISAETSLDSKINALSGEVETMGDEAIVDAEYISSSTTIDFYNAGGAVVAQVDASDFIVDGMVDDVRIENGYLVIDFNTASGKQDISIPLTDIFDPSNYYDKDDVDGLIADVEDRIAEDEEVTAAGLNALNDALSGKADSDDVYTKAEVDGKVDLKADLTALNNEISARTDADTALGNKIDGKVVELTQQQYDQLQDKNPLVLYVITDAVEVNMADYYKKSETSGATEIQTAINEKANSADVYTKSQVYTKAEVDEAIAEIDLSEIEDRISEDEEVTAAGLNAVNDKFGGLKLMKISRTDYDNLQVKDQITLYIVTD